MLDQVGCLYKPHVLGIQARQNLKVVSDDNTTHNIHPLPKVNQEWNVSQPPGADPIIRSFSQAGGDHPGQVQSASLDARVYPRRQQSFL